jgi:hypothetical protein
MPPQSALAEHIAKFKELYPEDWQSLVYRYKEHERHPPKGKSHPMPEPTQYLLTMVKHYYRKTNKVIARSKREAQPEVVTEHSHPEAMTAHSQPEVVTAYSQPEVVTAHSQPEVVTAHSQPEVVTAHSQPETHPEAMTEHLQPPA